MLYYDSDYMDMNLGFACYYLVNKQISNRMHTHNYYEYFIVVSGSIIHVINGVEYILKAGDLVFIREEDEHMFKSLGKEACELINISFMKKYFYSACEYIGEGIYEKIVSPEMPPLISVANFRVQSLLKKHDFFNFTGKYNDNIRIKFKLLLCEMLSMFLNYEKVTQDMITKNKITEMLDKMNTQEHIEEGIPAMLRLTGFSHGHLCRIMKEYYDMSPHEYLTELRMNYASNLLLNTNLDILTISFKTGYISLSNFIKLFKKWFGVTPLKYRQIYTKKKYDAM